MARVGSLLLPSSFCILKLSPLPFIRAGEASRFSGFLFTFALAMFAVIELGGQQWKVAAGAQLAVNRLPFEEGTVFTLDKALLVEKDGQTQIGTPYVPVAVQVKVERHFRGPKVIVFKKKRRKGYKRKRGHRQEMTLVTIQSL